MFVILCISLTSLLVFVLMFMLHHCLYLFMLLFVFTCLFLLLFMFTSSTNQHGVAQSDACSLTRMHTHTQRLQKGTLFTRHVVWQPEGRKKCFEREREREREKEERREGGREGGKEGGRERKTCF